MYYFQVITTANHWYWWPDTLIIARASTSEGSSALVVSRCLRSGNRTFLEVASMVVTWWIVRFLRSVYMVHPVAVPIFMLPQLLARNFMKKFMKVCANDLPLATSFEFDSCQGLDFIPPGEFCWFLSVLIHCISSKSLYFAQFYVCLFPVQYSPSDCYRLDLRLDL